MDRIQLVQYLGTFFFAIAVLHTFVVKKFLDLAHHYPKDSFQNSMLHFLGEVEVVFGLWAAVFLLIFIGLTDTKHVIEYNESIQFTEPLFIFCIMVMSSTRPIMFVAEQVIENISRMIQTIFRMQATKADMFVILTIGSLSGSFITEPAAMTVSAILLFEVLSKAKPKLLYATLAVLFVNVSIGGSLTHFAAPPILMVACKWGWDLQFVFGHFGWKAALAVLVNSLALVTIFTKEIQADCYAISQHVSGREKAHIPPWVIVSHLIFLVILVVFAHYSNTFMGIFLFFIGLTVVTKKYQESLRFKEGLLVAFFLGGIIVFGPFQKWWLEPILKSLTDTSLFYGAVFLTAFTDNAALTFLGSQVEGLTDSSKFALVEGALAGGGLTIIANAPNAAGFAILSRKFAGSLNPLMLFKYAVGPTLVAIICFWYIG